MRRRDLLGALGTAALGGAAGCAGLQTRSASGPPPLVEDRPDAVYLPTHVEGMRLVGTRSRGPYECALTYTYPHRFWLVSGEHRSKTPIKSTDTLHVMPVVWDSATGVVPPDLDPRVTVTRDGDVVVDRTPWPMLSQPMGFHFGDNVALDGDGTYRVEVGLGTPTTRRTGSLAGNEGGVTFVFEAFEFREATLDSISYRDVPDDEQGSLDAVEPMGGTDLPDTRAPAVDALPGTVRGRGTSGDAAVVVTTLDDAARFGGGEGDTYLAVSPRTPYNRYVLPHLSLSATLTRGGDAVFEGPLRATLDPALGTHYGAVVSGVESGDDLAVTVDAPPQVARHEGYETAFLEMPPVRLAP